ncbi:hypothetical protein ABIA39_006975 [Nocardia sp. GAS34]
MTIRDFNALNTISAPMHLDVVESVDDFDGKSPAGETVHFGIDGVMYEIDLSAKKEVHPRPGS